MQRYGKKRKRIVLTLEEKLKVIQERDEGKIELKLCLKLLSNNYFISGVSVDAVAEKYNIGASTVSEICKKRVEIENAVETSKLTGIKTTRKTLRESTKPMVEVELSQWYYDQLNQDFKPSASEFIQKAKEINAHLKEEPDDWNPSRGWLMRFKDRYNIKTESKPVDHRPVWESALEAADYLLDYIDQRDFQLKDVITVRMIRDRIAAEQDNHITEF